MSVEFIIYQILNQTESVVTFFFLCLTLASTLTYRKRQIPVSVSLLIAALFYALLYKPIESPDSFWTYWIIMLVLGSVYAWIFTSDHFIIRLTVCITYLSWITMSKSTISVCFQIYGISVDTYPGYLPFYVLFYLSMMLCFIFMHTHPLNISYRFPLQYWICMIVTPSLPAMTTNLALTGNSGRFAAAGYTPLLFILLSFSSIMAYYLSYIISSTSQKLTESGIINQKLEMQINQMERSSSMVEQIRRDKHEMKNVYFYIQSLLKTGQIEELEAFVDTKLVHRFDGYEEFQTGNKLLDYLLTQKSSEAKEYNISMVANILIPPRISIDDNDLCGLLLNLIDNALDAARQEKTGDIHISIRQTKNYLNIEVKNRTSRNILAENPNLRTTKTDVSAHGFGMKIVDSIVRKYNGMKTVRMEASYFVVNVMLQIGNSK